jgi:hypothetical protein
MVEKRRARSSKCGSFGDEPVLPPEFGEKVRKT